MSRYLSKRTLLLQLAFLSLLGGLSACSNPFATPYNDFPPPPATVLTTTPSTPVPPSATPVEAIPSVTPVGERTETGNTLIQVNGTEASIFTADNASAQGVDLWFNLEPQMYWTPNVEQVGALEEGLEAYLQEAATERYPRIWQELETYKRQYFGVILEGQRQIFGVYFCDAYYDQYDTWPDGIAAVSDGGDCFFELRYNVETGEFDDLSVHGEA